jgi:hypothetical protein
MRAAERTDDMGVGQPLGKRFERPILLGVEGAAERVGALGQSFQPNVFVERRVVGGQAAQIAGRDGHRCLPLVSPAGS